MALDDVINATKKAKGAESILEQSRQDSGFNAGREMAVYDGIPADEPALQIMGANPPAWHRDYAEQATGEFQGRAITAAQANLPDVFGAYGDPKKVSSYLVGRKPVTTGQPIDPVHKKAFEAFDALKDERSVDKFIGKKIGDLEGKAAAGTLTSATVGAMAFIYTQNRGLAQQALGNAAAKAREELETALAGAPQAYLEARYNAMSDGDKRGEAYALASGLL